jgi:hypothetical protein
VVIGPVDNVAAPPRRLEVFAQEYAERSIGKDDGTMVEVDHSNAA